MITFSILVIILERVSYLMQCWRPCPQSTGRQRLPLCNQLGTSSSHHHHHITIIIIVTIVIVIIAIIIIMPLHWHDPRRKGQRWRSIGKSSRFIKQVALWIWKEDFNFPKLWILPYCQSLGVKHPTVWKETNKSENYPTLPSKQFCVKLVCSTKCSSMESLPHRIITAERF